ncbi:MAG TPA: MerC family mercury resistance protein [Vicinamibacterales bacterium]
MIRRSYDADVTTAIRIGDRAGIVAAVGCAIHCLAVPLLASAQFVTVLGSATTEFALLSLSLLISGATIATSCLRGRMRGAVCIPFLLGAMLLLSARVANGLTPHTEAALVAAGAVAIVSAHSMNLLRCRCTRRTASCAAIV